MAWWAVMLALLCALGYTGASLLLKTALARGASEAQTNLFANIGLALVVQPMWLLDRVEIPNAPWWQPLLCCGAFFFGQIFTFAALQRGDVSVATPLMGTKVVMVTALNSLVFGTEVGTRWWIAAVAACVSVALIAGRSGKTKRGSMMATALFSLAASACFSVTDVLVQHWGGASDEYAYLPAMFGAVGIVSFLVGLGDKRAAFRPPVAARPFLIAGALLLGIQAGGMFLTLVWSQDATGANVVYTSRSVWSVLLAWGGGHFLGLRDREAGTGILLQRLLGALLLFGAILLILL